MRKPLERGGIGDGLRLGFWSGAGQVFRIGAVICLLTCCPANAEGILELWEHVLASNPTLKASEHRVEQARAQRDQALSKLLPNAGIRGYYGFNSYNRDVNGGGFNLYGAGNQEYAGYLGSLQVTQALFDLPSYLKLQGSDRQMEAEEQNALSQRMQLAFKLVDNYLSVLESEDQIVQLQAEKDSLELQLKRVRRMNESQMTKVTDLYEIEAYTQSVETALIEAVHVRAIAIEKLREVTGVRINHANKLIVSDFIEVPRTADEWVEEALTSNPLLISLQSGSEAAQQMIASAQSEHLPTASVSVQETISNTITNNLQVLPYNIGSALLNVNIPLYSGGGIEAGKRDAVQRYQISREKIEEARRTIEKETRASWFNVVSGRSRIDSTRKELGFREKAKVAQQRGYEVGTSNVVDVLEAHRRMLKASTEFSKARYDFIRSLISLRLNAGSLADLDLEQISPWFASETHVKGVDAHARLEELPRGSEPH